MDMVDLNSDLGESFGAYSIDTDDQVIRHITSANVACGWHAGDPLVMEKTVSLARQNGVAIGAHPGFPDLLGFGRRNMTVSPAEAKAYIKYQVGALLAFTGAAGVPLQHVKPHGAMYNMSAKDAKLARAICEGIAEVDRSLIVLGQSGSCLLHMAQTCGLRTACEVFADRAYNDDGTLVSRTLPGAMIEDEELAIRRVIRMIREGVVESVNGALVPIAAQSVCVHGDNPRALAFTQTIRQALQNEGIQVAPLSRFIP